MTSEEAKKMGAMYFNDEFNENGETVYLRRHKGVLQYLKYKNEWSDLLFNMPYKPLGETND